MKHITTLLPITSILFIALLAGCTTSDRTTEVLNENENAEVEETTSNSNEVTDVAENTNSDEAISDQVDTSDEVLRSPEDVADWLTYTNEEYGFSLKYPSDWKIVEKGNNLNFFSADKAVQLETDLVTSADLFLKTNEQDLSSIKDLYKNETNYRLINDNDNTIVISYDMFNEFANSTNTYYHIQNINKTKTLSAIFFQNSIYTAEIITIIQTIEFHS